MLLGDHDAPDFVGGALILLQLLIVGLKKADRDEAFGEETINSYIKLRKFEINEFDNKENFDKSKPVTQWERQNTLDC